MVDVSLWNDSQNEENKGTNTEAHCKGAKFAVHDAGKMKEELDDQQREMEIPSLSVIGTKYFKKISDKCAGECN